MFDAILHKEWIAGEKADEIIHFWAEDDLRARLTVPEQLRDDIIEMQNWLSGHYQKLECLKKELKEAEKFFFFKNFDISKERR